jgi:hypothetical protein
MTMRPMFRKLHFFGGDWKLCDWKDYFFFGDWLGTQNVWPLIISLQSLRFHHFFMPWIWCFRPLWVTRPWPFGWWMPRCDPDSASGVLGAAFSTNLWPGTRAWVSSPVPSPPCVWIGAWRSGLSVVGLLGQAFDKRRMGEWAVKICHVYLLKAEKSATFHQAEPLVGSQTSNRCSLEASQDDPFDCPFPRRRGTLNHAVNFFCTWKSPYSGFLKSGIPPNHSNFNIFDWTIVNQWFWGSALLRHIHIIFPHFFHVSSQRPGLSELHGQRVWTPRVDRLPAPGEWLESPSLQTS